MNYREQTRKISGLEVIIDKLKEVQTSLDSVLADSVLADEANEIYRIVNRCNQALDIWYAQRERYRREFVRLNGREPIAENNE